MTLFLIVVVERQLILKDESGWRCCRSSVSFSVEIIFTFGWNPWSLRLTDRTMPETGGRNRNKKIELGSRLSICAGI